MEKGQNLVASQDKTNYETPRPVSIQLNSLNQGTAPQLTNNTNNVSPNPQKSRLTTILVICSLIFIPISLIEDTWLSENIDTDVWGDTTFTQNIYIGLHEIKIETCVDYTDCEIDEEDGFSNIYDECQDNVDSEDVDEYCGPWGEFRNAGITATILIVVSFFMLIYAVKLEWKATENKSAIKSSVVSIVAGGLILISVIIWNSMLPDIADDLEWSYGPWWAIIASVSALAAGIIGWVKSQNQINTFEIDGAEREI